jgi:ankyrin repeat protein
LQLLTHLYLQDGWTALMWASASGHTAIVTLLLEAKGIRVNDADQVKMLA